MFRPYAQRLVFVLAVMLFGCLPEQTSQTPSESLEEALDDSALEHAAKHLDPKYVCPMHPQIVRDDAGSCPICGMDLVEKMLDRNVGKEPKVQIAHAVIQSMGVRTTQVERGTLWKYISTVGKVEYDETRLQHVHPRAEGWMERLSFRAEGEPVKRDQVLGYLYSPEILNAQVDFLIALNQSGKERVEKARNRLRLLGVTEGTINRIQRREAPQNTVPILSPGAGIVTMLGAREGMYVTPSMEIFTITDLSKVWVIVDVFEYQIAWLKSGLSAEITVPAYPGRRWEGRVDYIYPELDNKSRTLRVRLVFDNPEGVLKANMFAEAVIYGGPKRDVLIVPKDAVIQSGQRSAVVKALGGGQFQPVDVVIGMQRRGRVEILNGLSEGDEIVISGQFLIDSEANLQASFLRMQE